MRREILIITTHKEKLHFEEFVKPISKLLEENNLSFDVISIYDDSASHEMIKYDTVIITGTSLKDTHYIKVLDKNKEWRNSIRSFNKTIIGICAGMQVLALAHNLKLKKCEAIGVKKAKCLGNEFKIYDLHQYSIEPSSKIKILCSHKCIEAFKIKEKPHYGFAFHPEVFNKNILLDLVKSHNFSKSL